jgi:uncharacterized protein YgiM (DUF1202 family)
LKNRVISIVAMVAVLFSMMLVSMNVSATTLEQAATPAANKSGVTAKVIVAELSVRAQPSIRAVRLKIVKAAEAVNVIGKTANGFWYEIVTADGVTGWIGSAYVIVTAGKDADVPVIDAAQIPDVEACTPVVVNGRVNSVEGLALRAQPSNTAEKLAVLPAGTVVTITGQNTAGTWYLVTTFDKKKTGWVGAAYVFVTNKGALARLPFVDPALSAATPPPGCIPGTPGAAGTEDATPPGKTFKGKVNVASVNVRANPSTDADVLKVLKAGDSVTVTAQNQAETWLQVETSDGIVGWVGSAYVFLESGKLSDVPKVEPPPAG